MRRGLRMVASVCALALIGGVLASGAGAAPGGTQRRVRVVLLTFAGKAPTYTEAEATKRVFTAPNSARAFFAEQSNGALTLTNQGVQTEPRIIVHELGHNLGLRHAHGLKCTAKKCRAVGYQDRFDPMGYGSCAFGAWHREQLGWGPAITTVSASGTYSVASSAIRVARAADAFGRWYTVERNPCGTGLLIRTVANTSADTFLVDATPGSKKGFADAALAPGAKFIDAKSGVTIEALSASSVRVEVG